MAAGPVAAPAWQGEPLDLDAEQTRHVAHLQRRRLSELERSLQIRPGVFVPRLGVVTQHLHFRQPVAAVAERQRRLRVAVFRRLPTRDVPRHFRGEDGLLVVDHLQEPRPA